MLLEDRLGNMDLEDTGEEHTEEASSGTTAGPPKGLVVTNLAIDIFEDASHQQQFEATFLALDSSATFNYFKSFNRVRVNFSSAEIAASARDFCDLCVFSGQVVRCFLTQPIVVGSGVPHLLPPKREKQFLISPPASPPVGWEPVDEAQPLVNYDIISALADLAPGEAHELHPPSPSQPGIIVHVCAQDENVEGQSAGIRLPQTRRPAHLPPGN